MAKLECKIEVQSIALVETLILLLAKYEKDLPAELQASLHEIADCEMFSVNVDNMRELGWIGTIEIIADGVEIEMVTSINKILKRVEHLKPNTNKDKPNNKVELINGEVVTLFSYPKSLMVRDKLTSEILMEW